MTESKTVKPTVFEALNQVKTAIGAVGKGERNATQGFNFRGVDSVVNAAAPELNKFGVIVTPEVMDSDYETVEIGRNKTPMAHFTVVVKYTFWGPAGDSVSSTVLAEAMDSGDKAAAKAMSVAYRIALLQTLNLPTDEPDPDTQSYERSSATVTPLHGKADSIVKGVDWVKQISAAKTSAELNAIWKKAGSAGSLTDTLVDPSGEKVTLQELLYKRSDELKLKSGS